MTNTYHASCKNLGIICRPGRKVKKCKRCDGKPGGYKSLKQKVKEVRDANN